MTSVSVLSLPSDVETQIYCCCPSVIHPNRVKGMLSSEGGLISCVLRIITGNELPLKTQAGVIPYVVNYCLQNQEN